MQRLIRGAALGFCLTAVLFGGPVGAEDKSAGEGKASPLKAAVFTLEHRQPCGSPEIPDAFHGPVIAVAADLRVQSGDGGLTFSFSSDAGKVRTRGNEANWTVPQKPGKYQLEVEVKDNTPTAVFQLISAGNTPLVSREFLEQSLVGISWGTSLRTAPIFAMVGPGGSLNLSNDEGKPVVVQVDINRICWDVDRAGAIEMAESAGADYALFAEGRVIDLTEEVNPDGKISRQKSLSVQLDLSLVNVTSGQIVGAYSGEHRQMDLSREGAIRKAVTALARKGLQAITSQS